MTAARHEHQSTKAVQEIFDLLRLGDLGQSVVSREVVLDDSSEPSSRVTYLCKCARSAFLKLSLLGVQIRENQHLKQHGPVFSAALENDPSLTSSIFRTSHAPSFLAVWPVWYPFSRFPVREQGGISFGDIIISNMSSPAGPRARGHPPRCRAVPWRLRFFRLSLTRNRGRFAPGVCGRLPMGQRAPSVKAEAPPDYSLRESHL